MSELGRTFFGGSSFLRWTLGPVAILSAIAVAVLQYTRGSGLMVFLFLEAALLLLALTVIAPRRPRGERGYVRAA